VQCCCTKGSVPLYQGEDTCGPHSTTALGHHQDSYEGHHSQLLLGSARPLMQHFAQHRQLALHQPEAQYVSVRHLRNDEERFTQGADDSLFQFSGGPLVFSKISLLAEGLRALRQGLSNDRLTSHQAVAFLFGSGEIVLNLYLSWHRSSYLPE
jgi:hypothetical protein